ncbi:hypothetical protein [Nocardia carnea]|uniref:hypothetical protein n=1 Tax=Nocardia carnea TaxID=37328 RepID=UPI0003012A77|nr:hypothetical protein [Nocardia carnea]
MNNQTIPAYEMPVDLLRKTMITEAIKYMVGQLMFDPATKKPLDARTCAVIITGDDDVQLIGDPDHIRARLADPGVCAALLERWPDMRVLYQDERRN